MRVAKGKKTNESEAMLAMCMRHRTKWLVSKEQGNNKMDKEKDIMAKYGEVGKMHAN